MNARVPSVTLAMAAALFASGLPQAQSVQAQSPESPSLQHTKDSLAEVKQSVDAGKAVLVDVREQSEWDAGHLEQAILKPLKKLGERGGNPADVMKDVPKDKVVYCHCRAGGRALMAAGILKQLGYDVRPLKPGFAELLEAGFPKAP
jgi:rhodanese-related sulfurtransferase